MDEQNGCSMTRLLLGRSSGEGTSVDPRQGQPATRDRYCTQSSTANALALTMQSLTGTALSTSSIILSA